MSVEQTNIVDQLVVDARYAQSIINNYSQEGVDELILAVSWEVIRDENNVPLCELAVQQTGLGNVEDKIIKNKRKTIGLLRDLKDVKTVGIISEDVDKGIIEIAKPVGVIGAITPSTNPIATTINKVVNALKCRNSIILAPSPKGAEVCRRVVDLMQQALQRVGAPPKLVQVLPEPITKENTNELTKLVDLVVATGSQNNIKRALQTGTPTLGVGVGNVPSIIDDTADIKDAATKIKKSKTFDNATSCSSENSLVILKSIYKQTILELEDQGGILLNASEKYSLRKSMWDKNLVLNRQAIAKKAPEIANLAGLSSDKFANSKFLMVKETGIGKEYPFSLEKISPVLTVYTATDFDDAVEIASNLLINQGQGHSCSIHSNSEDNIMRLGERLPVCRVIVNQAHTFAAGGNFNNSLPFSLSMGCGTWGNNIVGDNLHYKHYLNITKVVKTIDNGYEPTESDIFSKYWSKWEKYSGNSTRTITSVIDYNANKTPNKTFLIDAELDLNITYKQLLSDIHKLGMFFQKNQIEHGDKVGFLLDNSYATTLLFLGSMYHGVVIVPINVAAGSQQIKYTIEHSGSKILFASNKYNKKFKIPLEDANVDVLLYESLNDLDVMQSEPLVPSITENTPAILIYTSGTTGVPKGVQLTHGNVLAGGENTVIAHKISDVDVSLCVLPLYHINAEMVSVASALLSNSCVVMMSKFSVSNFWQSIERYRCTWFSVVPTIINYLIHDDFDTSKLDLRSLRFGRSASAPLSPEVHKTFERVFGVNIVETMGLTETSAQILSNPLDRRKHGSAGIAYGNEVKIINNAGEFVQSGVVGELVIKGNNVMTAYYKNEEATKSAFTKDRYLLTGDLGYMDEDGFFFITGRQKDLIIKGGENISPREIDDILYQHDAILEACTFGVTDSNYGEDISSCVFLKDNYYTDEDELKQLCTKNLGEFKTPARIFFVDEPLPKGPSGKIQKYKIVDRYS